MNFCGAGHAAVVFICDRCPVCTAISLKEDAQETVKRLVRGDFTPEEFQNLCHHRDYKPGCTRADFEVGCREYQDKLFGPIQPVTP